jgi:hypothetical protein
VNIGIYFLCGLLTTSGIMSAVNLQDMPDVATFMVGFLVTGFAFMIVFILLLDQFKGVSV